MCISLGGCPTEMIFCLTRRSVAACIEDNEWVHECKGGKDITWIATKYDEEDVFTVRAHCDQASVSYLCVNISWWVSTGLLERRVLPADTAVAPPSHICKTNCTSQLSYNLVMLFAGVTYPPPPPPPPPSSPTPYMGIYLFWPQPNISSVSPHNYYWSYINLPQPSGILILYVPYLDPVRC